jgi:hypothetical protein
MKRVLLAGAGSLCLAAMMLGQGSGAPPGHQLDGKRLFEDATFGGNGRTCATCHAGNTLTLSPEDVQKRFKKNPDDVLFIHDGSDDGLGGGTARIQKDATILIRIPLPDNVSIQGSTDRFVVLRRGIPTLQNTPALDRMLMLDGRQPSLQEQAAGAIHDHAQAARPPDSDLDAVAEFQKTNAFYSSPDMRRFALGGPARDCLRETRILKREADVSSKMFHRIRLRVSSRVCAHTVTAGHYSTRRINSRKTLLGSRRFQPAFGSSVSAFQNSTISVIRSVPSFSIRDCRGRHPLSTLLTQDAP